MPVDEKRVIVIADDDQQIATLVRYKLEKMGYTVHVSGDGQSAYDLISSIKPDLVVLDVMMPVMNGFQVLRLLKGSPETRHIPEIMLTARQMEEDVLKAFELGAVDYMTKPFSPVELAARVRAAFNGSK
jgi:DNA-binding response OmpR family regulator